MMNKAMERKLADGECLDVGTIGSEVEPGVFELRRGAFEDGVDYCVAATE